MVSELEYYQDKRILVTGGAGAIGHNLLFPLKDVAKEIIVIDDLSSGHLFNIPDSGNIIFVKASILEDKILTDIFSKKINIVFHLAANFANQNSVDNPEKDLKVNSLGTLKMLQFSKRNGVERFIYTSSSCVYGNRSGVLTEDKTSYTLDTPYAISKLSGEYYTNFFHNQYDLPTVILRYFNSYGEGECPGKYRNVIPNFIWRAMNNKPLFITGTGNETRDFTYVGDIIGGTLLAGKSKEALGKVINLGRGQETKITDLACSINKIVGNSAGIEFKPRRDWDHINSRQASIELAKNLIGFKPKTDLDEGLKKTYEWLLQKREVIKTPSC